MALESLIKGIRLFISDDMGEYIDENGHKLLDSRVCGFRHSHSELAITHTCGEEKGFILRYVIRHGSRVSDIRNTTFDK